MELTHASLDNGAQATVEGRTVTDFAARPSLIAPHTERITPDMLSLVDLDQRQIDAIVETVPGGAKNVEDIYPLSPLQEGMLFDHLLNEQSDTYVLSALIELSSHSAVVDLIKGMQQIIERHDALRSAVLWKNLPRPVQVIYRQAILPVREVTLDAQRDAVEQLEEYMTTQRQEFSLHRAPLLRLLIASDPKSDRWYTLIQRHHIVFDHQSWNVAFAEAVSCGQGRELELPRTRSYRQYVAWALEHAKTQDAEAFFRGKLGDVSEPTAPFGLLGFSGDANNIEEARGEIELALSQRIRASARAQGVSAARLFHAAWALVVARTSARDDVVCGTVLSGARKASGLGQSAVGLFVNTLPLRLNLRDLTVQQLVRRAHEELCALRDHQHACAALAQRCTASGSATPLFSAVLNYRHSAGHSVIDRRASQGAITLVAQRYRTNYPIMLVVDDLGDAFKLTAQTDRNLDANRIVEYACTAIRSLVEALEQAPQTLVSTLSIVPEQERRRLQSFNATKKVTHDKLVHELFELQVERSPNAIAVTYGGQTLSYAELNRRANWLARYLRDQGVGPDQLVAVHLERGPEMVVALLATLKAGAAYVPLDPNYPVERLQYMLDDAAPKVVLTQERLWSSVPDTDADIVALDALLVQMPNEHFSDLPSAAVGVSPRNLVYVIYTSGTTGRPKGTMMPHRSMVNLIEWHRRTLPLREGQRVLQFAALSFDVAFQEIFSTLCLGGSLVLLDEWVRRDAAALTNFLAQNLIERLFVPPLMLQSLAEYFRSSRERPHGLRDVIVAGEQLRVSPEIVSLFDHLQGCRLHNHYGPTETHVVTALTLDGDPHRWPPLPTIGQPIANTQIHVLDTHRQEVPLGVVGEIYIAGANVARGYFNRPELTAERFVTDPFSTDPLARMYKTGDLGRWRADGSIEYLGRNDDQVKIRGFRIELGEIEAQLALHAEVKEAAVVAREDVPGHKRLVGYVTPRDQGAPTVESLREYLQALLPEHMVPSAFVVLKSLPLTPSGKLNRRALPAPALDAYLNRPYEAPQGEVEAILAGIWRELLGVDRVGRGDNFFELGGHSLLLVQVMERLRRVGLSVKVRSIYESRTLADLARTLTGGNADESAVPPNSIPADCDRITPDMLPLVALAPDQIERIVQLIPGGARNVQDIYPLAPLQDGMLFHHLFNEQGGDIYIVSMLFSLPSRQRLDEFVEALQWAIDRHDILRTSVLWHQLPVAVQVVWRRATLPVQELTLDGSSSALEQLKERMRPDRQRIDIRQAPMMRLEVAKDAQDEHWYAVLQLHHLLGDHESLDTMLLEVVSRLKKDGREPPQAWSYRNHVAQALAYDRAHDTEAFFRGKLQDVDEPTAPFGLLDVRGDGSRVGRVELALDAELAQRVRAHARRLGVSAATLFHAAWALVVSHTSGREDVVFGTVLLGRLQGSAGAHRILGLFMNTLPLRLRLDNVTTTELVERTQRELVDLLSYEQASLAVAQRCSGVGASAPLFNTLLNYRWSTVDLQAEFAAAGMKRLEIQSYTNYPLAFSVLDRGDEFWLEMQSDRRVDPRRVMRYAMTAIQSLADALEWMPQKLALTLPVLPIDERQQVLEQFNAMRAPFPREQLIHELFEERASRIPEAIAVVYEGESLTYAELNGKANQLARYLRSKGVGPDQLVALCVQRGLEMMVGLLGILKSGGAYVPLDPDYPLDRIAYVLEDAAPKVLLTQSHLKQRLTSVTAEVIALDGDWGAIAAHGGGNLAREGLCSSHLAYVIYTSGSTGHPKGVMIEHRNVVNLWHGLERLYDGTRACKRIALNASFTFDASVQQVVQLLSGRTLFIVPQEIRLDPVAMLRFLKSHLIDGVDCTPSQLKSWVAVGMLKGQGAYPRLVLVGGEAIDPELWSSLARSTRIEFFNVYGPTECTVDATSAHLNESAGAPHIGCPMVNRRVYILDRNSQPVPIGAIGEIYIGGAGVGRGYLNRPELTAERFLRDPFCDEPGARVYRTGDIGRWSVDGTIEYLGRNDDQVKIRGYRIEIGEIEARLASHHQVKEAAVIVREDASGEKRLVAYSTLRDPSGGVSAEDLRLHTKATLPDYMVPSAFVIVEKFPLTSSGKLDRRALPTPDLDAYATRHYEAPCGDVEIAIATDWAALLRVKRVGRHDNFFDLGGHSGLVLRALFSINQTLGSSLTVSDIYKHPTVAELGARISGHSNRDERVNLVSEATLDERIVALPGRPMHVPRHVLLTGATGFVGRFLLAQLLEDTDATVHCLVRARSRQEAALRLRTSLVKWDLWRDEIETRVVAVPGDLRLPGLGLDALSHGALCESIDSIYHCATSMNHLETYAMAKAANVGSARELLKLATIGKPKLVNYVSTLGVFSSSTPARVVYEHTSIDHEEHWTSRGYAASKWVGEKIFMIANGRGIPCNIFRLGLVWADAQEGRYDELQRDYRVIKSCLLSGYGIKNYHYEAAPIPADYAARAIVLLANRHPDGNGIFHVASGSCVEDLFERCNEAAGTSLELLPYYDWICEMKRLHDEGRSLPVVPLIEFAFGMDLPSFLEHQRRARAVKVRVDCGRTQSELTAAGMGEPVFDDDLLRACIEDMLARDDELQELTDQPGRFSMIPNRSTVRRLRIS